VATSAQTGSVGADPAQPPAGTAGLSAIGPHSVRLR
jgi:hypothetical protein